MQISKIPFHKSLFYTITSLFVVFVIVIFLFQYNREEEFRKQILNSVLQDYNIIINRGLEEGNMALNTVDSIINVYTKDSVRITVLDLQGNVLFDNGLFDRTDTLKKPYLPSRNQTGACQRIGLCSSGVRDLGKKFFLCISLV